MKPAADARTRLPREPYPGLRPFLAFEAALLFGRERQVREVIERLQATQFVAVLGGSGSGKSSLIHAGMVPELRSFGIPGAGDLWLPMTCTPGTNVSAADSLARRQSPITRLARRFAGLLKSKGSVEADQQRLQQIADVVRQEAGLARLLDTFGAELDVPPGPDPAEARVLFVLDQFEEVFHPTNQGVADASLLVERVLDHFFDPHPRCHVVLTMRSEHLNDCAAYLELPDAINKSSYLIRRLGPEELHQAIVGPAQRFLRLAARSAPPGAALPAQVVFEPEVLARLLRDVQALAHDPDHLPLLQHLLARLWQAALEREEMDVPVPSRITEIDLVRAVHAKVQGDEVPLDARLNTLRACVENWPERLYRWHEEPQRQQLEMLFGPALEDLLPLIPAVAGSACAELSGLCATMPDFRIQTFEQAGHCFRMARGGPRLDPADEALRPARDELRVAVHERPTEEALARAKASPPPPLAGLVPFAQVATADAGAEGAWFVAAQGPYAGWLLYQAANRSGGQRFIGMPWSTCALWRLGMDLSGRNAPSSAAQAGATAVCGGL